MPLVFSKTGRRLLSKLPAAIASLSHSRRKSKPAHRAVDLAEALGAFCPAPVVDESKFDCPSQARATRPQDRLRGASPPAFENEQDLHRMRGIARSLASVDEHAIGILENLTNYVLGTGFAYAVVAKAQAPDVESPAHSEWTRSAGRVIDEFLERFAWTGGLERELFRRAHRDGEFFLWLSADGMGRAQARIIEPECVTEPADPRRLERWLGEPRRDWSFGVASDPSDAARVYGYFVERGGVETAAPDDWLYIPASQMVHCKLNVDASAKRGVSDFFAVYETLERADRLLGNTLQGAAVRAAIAYITEHAPGVSGGQIQNLTASLSDATFVARTPSGVRTIKLNQREAGTRLDVEHGRVFHAGMQGAPEGPSHVQVIQAALRRAGARWQMPEYMVSGDASNANYASTLVAESPFVKAAEAQQAIFRRAFKEVLWKALEIAAADRQLPASAVTLRRLVDVSIESPTIAVRNRREELDIRQALAAAGILSKRTWAEQSGLDYDREQARRAAEEPSPQPSPEAEEGAHQPEA
jgi:hypothetical protein